LQGFLTPLIALLAPYIAWQQWKGNQLKLRMERYDRRLRIYQEVVRILSLIIRDADVKPDDLLKFRTAAAEADFLFGPEIPKYIDEIYSRGLKLWRANTEYHATQGRAQNYDHDKVVEAMDTQLKWLTDEISVVKEKFKRYLNISE
jgi:hypothetical protein